MTANNISGELAELADALDLGSSIERCKGSSPLFPTKGEKQLDSYLYNNKLRCRYDSAAASSRQLDVC